MYKIKDHIVIKFFTLVLGILLLMPTATKFAHIFSHHKHDICKGEKSTHLHEINTDCDFYKFKIATTYTLTEFTIKLFIPKKQFLEVTSQYYFISEFQRLQTLLRGPPSFI